MAKSMVKDNLTGEFTLYRPAVSTYGSVVYGGVERCQCSPIDADSLDDACQYARRVWGTGAFAVRVPNFDIG